MESMENRTALRVRSVLKAEIRYNNGLRSMPCLVRDISETGARLELGSELALPDHFDLYIEKRRQTHSVVVKRQHGKEVGVAFLSAPAAPPATDANLSERVVKLEAEIAELRGLVEKLLGEGGGGTQ